MADTCAEYTFGGVTVNGDPSTDGLVITDDGDIQGLDGAPITRQIDPAGSGAGAQGSITQNAVLRGRVITFTGAVQIGTQPDPHTDLAAYVAKVNAVEAATISALEAQLNSATNLSWSGRSISCKYGIEGGECKFTGPMIDKKFEFTLISETPTIS